ncbi:PilN domain-containing protein [Collimonas humicola]|uniref:PilN domain-containing protein n=1 Tax=Collimonas humicola TaxID=2825886 RepID=UPI001B8BAAD9|nr:PilN domain-containing protein [Collimonas humicola]
MMKTIRIDFAPRSLARTISRTGWRSWLCGALALALCLSAIAMTVRLTQQQQRQQARIDSVLAQTKQRTAAQPAAPKLVVSEGQATAVNTAIRQLNLPWRDLFEAIEGATPTSIALLSLEPDAKRQVIRGLAEAKNSDDMVDYIAQLKQQKLFTDVVLNRHEMNDKDVNRPLRFQFQAQWGNRP